ncbi:hypothetical protein [Salegentibacter mishustinae]|uniref:Uncharacterized protein n=1 Tax=Salegentibacter mishustinae TaxID=270918 RepID=A0A0Q9ZNS2_9FLAO|nr:hypothetical protein [Salegentibacter mishustinae]KRG30551.1 hypothetical protein APR42_01405 [Salegentibacter mishustinae]PNW23442.1 hypothetical protein APB85_01400 [Salegentibacter mishustinae]PZX66509.1 hypothetical protein LY54_00907 [Salegentibacter mishustinae]GGW82947.1 hypothetical protein GCM10008086_08700 [Salegentibacter mishustinae]
MAKEINLDIKIKHLEFLQNIITRMNSNSFYIKGWTITLVSAIFAISKEDSISYSILFLGVPIFWSLDAFYLSREKQFRKLYELVSADSKNIEPFSLNIEEVEKKKINWFRCLFSITIGPIYMVIIAAIFLLKYYN